MKFFFCAFIFFFYITANSQYVVNNYSIQPQNIFAKINDDYSFLTGARKLFQRNHGIILGLQRGRSTAIELGGEAHWRKMALVKPHIIGATANMEYNFGDHVIGYKAGMWMKRGRINFTYGGNFTYFNDFKGLQRFGIGPSIGFRLMGFHLINGYNFLGGDKELDKINTLYITMRYYFPLENKFTWDRKTMKKKEKRKKERAKEKKQREKEKESEDKKGIRKILDF